MSQNIFQTPVLDPPLVRLRELPAGACFLREDGFPEIWMVTDTPAQAPGYLVCTLLQTGKQDAWNPKTRVIPVRIEVKSFIVRGPSPCDYDLVAPSS